MNQVTKLYIDLLTQDNPYNSSNELLKILLFYFQDIKLCVISTNLIPAPLFLTQHMAEDLVLLEN